MKKTFNIIKLTVIATAILISTTPVIKPMAWLIGYE